MKLLLFCAALAAVASGTGASAQTPPKPAPKPAAPPATKAAEAAPPLAWKTYLNRLENAPLAVASNTEKPPRPEIYLAANNALLRLDDGGRTQWATVIGATRAQAATDGAQIFVGTDRGAFYAVLSKTGNLAWKTLLPGANQTAPCVFGPVVIVETSDGNVTALQTGGGKIQWTFKRPDGSLGYGSPIASDGAVFVCGDNTLYKLNAETGKEAWRISLGGKSLGTPTISGANVIVAGDGSGVCAVNSQTGKLVWRFDGTPATKQNDWFGSPLALSAGGVVFVSSYNRYVYSINSKTGKMIWSYRLLGNALSQPAYDAKTKTLYVTSSTFRNNPTVTALDAVRGTKKWDAQAGYVASAPVLSSGFLYAASLNGYLYAFDVR